MRLTVGKGMDEYLSKLGNLEYTAPQSIGKAIYEGAKIVADAVKGNIQNMRISEDGLSEEQRKGLEKGFGISKAETKDGYRNVKLGFSGSNNVRSKNFPKGEPNVMVARQYEFGDSETQKQPFVAPAVRRTKGAAEEKMKQVIDTEITKIMGGAE